MTDLHPDIERILISEEDIQKRVTELAVEIDRDYRNEDLVAPLG